MVAAAQTDVFDVHEIWHGELEKGALLHTATQAL